jgi:hypothetical protein
MRDNRGQFTNGNKGKPKGATSKRTQQWEALADSICGEQAEYFSQYIKDLWTSQDSKKKAEAADLYLKTVEYFKPKQSRVESDVKIEGDPITFILPKD